MELISIENQTATEISALSDDDLRAFVARAVQRTAKDILELAMAWAEMERRKLVMTDLRSGLRDWLPLVASGHLIPEAVVHFNGRVQLLRAISTLKRDEQLALVKGKEIVVVTLEHGAHSSTKLRAEQLRQSDITLVFAPGRIRTTEEQIDIIHGRARDLQRRLVARTVKINLSAIEYVALKAAAKAKRKHMSTLVMDTLRKEGLIGT